ncbi:CAMK/CAMKL protein kinase [Aphanomyces invadans]|uniref:CAMK/CAMKL protein kinase n=1 Tax=Aphanomyces invadans TaxID=157072 RepID=A0A024TZ99_9STRA|nr:CAMK/CAMKL protein kinase [Aphanomyces invadans]ETV99480.1 CAMK/CAMKL protein kinase [Aphanomyces invadans]|eukprot:XP_008872036.1 CAMK/CAMKL protein kinase [Aphanomyces invadans]
MDQYKTDKMLAKALYGKVLLCTDKKTKDVVVIKRIQLDAAKKRKALVGGVKVVEDAEMEKRVYRALRDAGGHPNVLQMSKDFVDGGFDHFVLEHCVRGELFMELEAQPDHRLSAARTQECFSQIVHGLAFMHEQGFAHGDLSLENVFVTKNGTCKLGDFGLASDMKALKRQCAGKFFYMAPEMYMGLEYDPAAADVWSLGIVLFMMVTGTPLFDRATPADAGFRFMKSKGLRGICDEYGLIVSSDVMELLEQMLQVQPCDRLTLAQVRDHSFVLAAAAAEDKLTSLMRQCSITSVVARGA